MVTKTPPNVPSGKRTGGGPADAKVPKVEIGEVRALAERLDSLRDEEYVVVDQNGKLEPKKQPTGAERQLFKVHTESWQPNRVKPKSIVLETSREKKPLQKDYDAFFWTESSIEKFFFPYYYAHRLLKEDDLQRLVKDFQTNERIVGYLHMPPSRPSSVLDALESGAVVKLGPDEKLEVVDLRTYLTQL